MSYIYAEPEQITGYRDAAGQIHEDRDAAIAANVDADIRVAVCAILDLKRMPPEYHQKTGFENVPVLPAFKLVRLFIERNPDLVRMMLGDL